jgi:hypothetical protein
VQPADKNIEESLEDLNRKYHQLRQSSIDEELFDVISGFEPLSNPLHRPVQKSHEDAELSKVGT